MRHLYAYSLESIVKVTELINPGGRTQSLAGWLQRLAPNPPAVASASNEEETLVYF